MADPRTASAAAFYCAQLGFSLVSIPLGTKGPTRKGWNRAGVRSEAGARAYWGRNPMDGIGLLHAESGTATFDQDTDAELVALALDACGVDYAALMALSGPKIVGNPSKPCKPLYRVPPAVELKTHKLVWPSRTADPKEVVTVLELRTGRVQDVLPPTIHPDTSKPYRWDPVPRSRDDIPFIPDPLLRLWLEWSALKPLMEAACPWAPERPAQEPRTPRGEPYTGPSIIAVWNERVHASVVLERNGYQPAGDGRWLAPGSTTGEPGLVVLDDGRLYSHHGSDPLHCDHSHDSFSVLAVLEHGGDQSEAAYSARAELGMLEDGRPEVSTRAPVVHVPEPRTESESAELQRSRDVEPTEEVATDWLEPKPIPSLSPVEPFTKEMLPELLRGWAVDVSERMQTPLDYAGVASMIGLAAVVGRQLAIRPEEKTDWAVVPNLWGDIVGRPGVLKSPAIREALRPLRRLEGQAAGGTPEIREDRCGAPAGRRAAGRAEETPPAALRR